MPPAALQPYDATRGMISCFTEHGLPGDPISPATDEALCDLLVDHYEEAFRRLPDEDVPDSVELAHLVDTGGLCLGLLDPVTNIVLNTLSLLPNGFGTTNPSPPAPSGPRRREERSRDSWRTLSWRSSQCLLEFMRAYFGLLTQEQARRYLVWALADLAVAVLLVEHELYVARPAFPDPRSGRTRNSLRLAATHVGLPWPDHLVSLATAWLPRERIQMLAPVLRRQGGMNRLHVQDVKTILDLLRHQDDISTMTTMPPSPTLEEGVGPVVEHERTTSCADLGDGRIAYTTVSVRVTTVQRAGDHIASLRPPRDMDFWLSSYSTHASPPAPGTTTKLYPHDFPCASFQSLDADADACPHVRSLEMSLYGTIHGFYLKALAMLPSHAARHHVRGILLAGHCYGPMDPVSNIILSAVWYDANFPLQEADRTQAHDILDTLPMLRPVCNSLHGPVALLHATSGQKLPPHEILKYLCYAQCDLSAMLLPHLQGRRLDGSSPNPNPFVAAATVAQHPQASAIAGFLTSLAPTKLDRIWSLMMSASARNGALSHKSLTQIYSILREETSAMMIPWQPRPPKLCKTALSILARKREAYAENQSFIRGRIEQLLQDYAVGHPSEPKYDLDFICAATIAGHMNQRYGVNFMASTKSTFKNTFFFAEFMWAYEDQSDICCPLPQPCDMARCYYGHESARSITYPDHSVDYFSGDDITIDTQGELHMDFMFFDSQRDVQLAKVLQTMAKKGRGHAKVIQRSGMVATGTGVLNEPLVSANFNPFRQYVALDQLGDLVDLSTVSRNLDSRHRTWLG